MKLDLLSDLLTKHMGARKDGNAFVMPDDAELTLVVSLDGEALTIPRVTRVVQIDPTILLLETYRNERIAVAVEDIRVVKADKPESGRRERAAGFGK